MWMWVDLHQMTKSLTWRVQSITFNDISFYEVTDKMFPCGMSSSWIWKSERVDTRQILKFLWKRKFFLWIEAVFLSGPDHAGGVICLLQMKKIESDTTFFYEGFRLWRFPGESNSLQFLFLYNLVWRFVIRLWFELLRLSEAASQCDGSTIVVRANIFGNMLLVYMGLKIFRKKLTYWPDSCLRNSLWISSGPTFKESNSSDRVNSTL